MPVAPARLPAAAGEDTMPVARFERPTRRRRYRPGGSAELIVQLAPAGDPADRGVAGIALHRLGGHRAATLEFTGWRAPGSPARVSRLARMISCGRGPALSCLPPELRRASPTTASAQ